MTTDELQVIRERAEKKDALLLKYAQTAALMAFDNNILEEVATGGNPTLESLIRQVVYHNKKAKKLQTDDKVRESRAGGMLTVESLFGVDGFEVGGESDIPALLAEVGRLQGELALWRPLTIEEAEAALTEAEAVPISEEQINEIVQRATDPTAVPNNSEYAQMAARIRQLESALAAERERAALVCERLADAAMKEHIRIESINYGLLLERAEAFREAATEIMSEQCPKCGAAGRDTSGFIWFNCGAFIRIDPEGREFVRHHHDNCRVRELEQRLAKIRTILDPFIRTEGKSRGVIVQDFVPLGDALIAAWELTAVAENSH